MNPLYRDYFRMVYVVGVMLGMAIARWMGWN